MLITESGRNVQNELAQIQEATQNLKVHSSKLYSQKLHLQSLIAKRDRIDFEIRNLKKKISTYRKDGHKARKMLHEHITSCWEILQESSYTRSNNSDFNTSYAHAISAEDTFDEIDRIIEILLDMKPFDESDQF